LRMDRVGSANSVCCSAGGAAVVGFAFIPITEHTAGQGWAAWEKGAQGAKRGQLLRKTVKRAEK
jgi:hypothetical protein